MPQWFRTTWTREDAKFMFYIGVSVVVVVVVLLYERSLLPAAFARFAAGR